MLFELHPEEAASLASFDPSERRISIFADSEAGQQSLQSIATHIGARVLFCGPIETAAARLSDYAAGDAVFADVGIESGSTLDLFVDRLDALSRIDRIPVLINSGPDTLDAVSARMNAPLVALMSEASPADWIAAFAMSGLAHDLVLQDTAIDDSLRLQRLADEVQRIARTLSELVGNDASPLRGVSDALIGFRAEPLGYVPPPGAITASDVRSIIRLRRLRDRFLRSDLFADPAWDMLLDLTAARLERMRVSVSSLCIAAAVPPTTALRWIKTMTDNGMFVRVADAEDGRRVFIDLSDGAAAGMTAYLSAAKASGGLAV